ncbi:MAG: hypothetical protein HY396_02675 [Candidatus Doudnabacteria bacterium]|nr:hypothetical protein [Candidatus Doudnabacteria bacterium]
MLENLLNSKLKKRLLAIFFGYPARSFTADELRRMTESQTSNVQVALRELIKADVVSLSSRRQKRIFRINSHFRLHDELKDLINDFETQVPGDEVVKILKRFAAAKLVILSGVFTFQPQLPADILIVGEGINSLRLSQIISEIEKIVGQEVNYTVMEPSEYLYRKMMSDRLVRDILDYPHLVLVDHLR